MFTGLIQTTAELLERRISGSAGKLRVRPKRALDHPEYGESIAVNGACLTLERALPDGSLEFHTLAETLDRTNLGLLPTGATLNLERALRLGDRLGGHLVTGHVDAACRMLELRRLAVGDWELAIAMPAEIALQIVEKGSVAIDGVSLTVAGVEADSFTVRLIPVTLQDTALEARRPGETVNIETDLLGKYVARLLGGAAAASPASPPVTMETLFEAGFLPGGE